MGNFIMRPEDEFPHKAGPEANFNESVYTNGFDTTTPVGGWMRLGNRVNEGHAELSSLPLFAGWAHRLQFPASSRSPPTIGSTQAGSPIPVLEPLKKVSMRFEGELHHRRRPRGVARIH